MIKEIGIYTLLLIFLIGCGGAPEEETQEEPPKDTRVIGPTSSGFLIVEDTKGRKAELDIFDRTPAGVLKAKNRSGHLFHFPESTLTDKSIDMLYQYKSKNAAVSIQIQDLQSHAGGYETRRYVDVSEGESSIRNYETDRYESANASHIVTVTTTTPFPFSIKIETYYTNAGGTGNFSRQSTKKTIEHNSPVKIEMKGQGRTSTLQPVVIVRNEKGEIMEFRSRNPSVSNRLSQLH